MFFQVEKIVNLTRGLVTVKLQRNRSTHNRLVGLRKIGIISDAFWKRGWALYRKQGLGLGLITGVIRYKEKSQNSQNALIPDRTVQMNFAEQRRRMWIHESVLWLSYNECFRTWKKTFCVVRAWWSMKKINIFGKLVSDIINSFKKDIFSVILLASSFD